MTGAHQPHGDQVIGEGGAILLGDHIGHLTAVARTTCVAELVIAIGQRKRRGRLGRLAARLFNLPLEGMRDLGAVAHAKALGEAIGSSNGIAIQDDRAVRKLNISHKEKTPVDSSEILPSKLGFLFAVRFI
ncbi:hypothetical protein VPH49_21990 [Pseudomonas luteola]|uniref:hypothetical protein n=1 Tax=Pseudomonas luteola TaxID=47886 RepID=UPI003A882888